MNVSFFNKLFLFIAFSVFLSLNSFAQNAKYEQNIGPDEFIEWLPGGTNYNIGLIYKNGADNSSSLSAIRFTTKLTTDEPCVVGMCESELSDLVYNNLAYNNNNFAWVTIAIPEPVPSPWGDAPHQGSYQGWQNLVEVNTYDEVNDDWVAWNGGDFYIWGSPGHTFTNTTNFSVGNTQYGSYDWTSFPLSFSSDGFTQFRVGNDGYGHNYVNAAISVNYGNSVAVELESVTTDNTVTLIGEGSLSTCASTDNVGSWHAVSEEIYGDNLEHGVALGPWSDEFSLPILTPENTVDLGPSFTFDYTLYYRELGRGCAMQREFNPNTISTTDLIPIDRIIALNQEDGNVKLKWSHLTGVSIENLSYTVKRTDDPDSDINSWRTVYKFEHGEPFINYTLNEGQNVTNGVVDPNDEVNSLDADLSEVGFVGQFTDHTADPEETYLYSIKTEVVNQFIDSILVQHSMSTGAGISFFNDNTQLNFDTPTPLCDGFEINGVQSSINEEIKFGNEDYEYDNQDHILSFNSADFYGTQGLSQRVLFYENSELTDTLFEPGTQEPIVIAGNVTNIDNITLPLVDSVFEKTVYGIIKATRTDGKVFRSFKPRVITGNRKPRPTRVDISSANFDDYVTLRFTNVKEVDDIDRIKIYRTARTPINQAINSAPTETTTYSAAVELDSVVLTKANLQDLIVEGGDLIFQDKPGTATSFTGASTVLCNEYTYQIQSYNCGNVSLEDSPFYHEVKGDSMDVTPTLTEDVFELGNPLLDLKSSKGEFADKVHLIWNNNSSGVIDHYSIERRQYGSDEENAWIQLGSVTTGEKYFEDTYAEANLLYEYRVQAHIGNCATSSPEAPGVQANVVSSHQVGYRRPVGRVTGRITYNQTSNPVSDVYVKVEPIINEDQTTNRSLNLASNYGIVRQPIKSASDLDAFTVTFWMKSMTDQQGVLFSRKSTLYNMSLYLEGNTIGYSEYSGSVNETYPAYNLKPEENSWNNVTLTFTTLEEEKQVKLYINGSLMNTYTSQFTPSIFDDFIFGVDRDLNVNSSFDGLMDEMVLWKRALSDEEIQSNYFKFLSSSDDDLIFFITADEGLGEFSYDISSSIIDVFNRNHMELNSLSLDTFSIPNHANLFYNDTYNTELLHLGSSTSSGMYDVTDIRYINDGNNFSITPFTILNETYSVIHEFLPAQSTGFIGDQTNLITSLNFNDLTSITVQGNVFFDVTEENSDVNLIDKTEFQIGVEDVFVKVGGKRVQNEDGEVKTNADGYFTMSIPIGEQCISFEKNGHTFYYGDLEGDDDNRYCQEFSFNSEQNLPNFSCNTYKELRGRITGGQTYNNQSIEDIAIGFNLSANTIGSVGFDLMPNDASVLDYEGYLVSVQTNVLTGEYHAKLLPIIHKVNSASWISSNYDVENHYRNQQQLFPTIDMKVIGENDANGDFVEELTSSVYGSYGTQPVTFNKRFDLVYRNNPSILVSQNISGNDFWTSFIGEESIEIEEGYSITTFDNTGYFLGMPVFEEKFLNGAYRYNIEVSEVYTNYGSILLAHNHNSYMYKDQNGASVYNTTQYLNPLQQGDISIFNTMMKSSNSMMSLDDLNGSIDYEFTPDDPFVFGKEQGYLRKFIIQYQDGSVNAQWPKLSAGQNASTRGDVYVFGDESYGNDFFTFGPQTVDMILRDPNGDGSYSSITEGSTISRTSSVTNVNGYSKDWNFKAGIGLQSENGLGVIVGSPVAAVSNSVKWSAKAFATIGMSNSATLTNSSENIITISETFNHTISTNSADWEVGAKGDLYIGESKNLNFGTSKELQFLSSHNCALGGGVFDCLDYPLIKQNKTIRKQYEIDNETNDTVISILEASALYELSSIPVSSSESIISDSTYSSNGKTYIIHDIEEVASYQIGTQREVSIKPGVTTKFAYSNNYIQNYLLTKLALIKNTYLFGEYTVDTDLLPTDHECFGEPSNSTCFDSYEDQSIRNYYTIPETSSEEYYELPVLTNYDVNTLTAILGSTYQEFQSNFEDADYYIGYSVSNSGINNDEWNSPLYSLESETSGFGFSINGGVTPELVQYLNFVNTGPLFGTGLDIEISAYLNLNGDLAVDPFDAYDNISDSEGSIGDGEASGSISNGNTTVGGSVGSSSEDGVNTASASGDYSSGGVNAGISVDISVDDDPTNDAYANEQQLSDLLMNFASVQDFTTVPGFINLNNLIGDLTLDVPEESETIVIPRDKVQFYAQQIKLWKRAMAQNELDKIESEFLTNHSINGGISVEQSHTSVGAYSNTNSITYDLSSVNNLGADFSGNALVVGFNADFSYNNKFTLEFKTATNLSGQSQTTTNYKLSDNDQGDIISIDVNESNYGFGPIFKVQAGATSCPWESVVNAKYIRDFDLYFELKFYDEFVKTGLAMPSQLMLNSNTFDFTFYGSLAENELNVKKASYVDYSRTTALPIKSVFDQKRLEVYNAVREALLVQHNSMFASDVPYELSATTSQIDKPIIDVFPSVLYNVNENEQAVFNITLGNASENNSDRIFNLRVIEASNPHGAIIKIDGIKPNRDFAVPAGGSVNKTLTVNKGPDSLNYENLKLVIYPACQYEFGTSDEYEIADTISFSAYFLPTCTDIVIKDTDDDWLVNIADTNLLTLKLQDYNINYYSLRDVYFDYKFENEPWSPIEPQSNVVNPHYVINKLENYKTFSPLDLYNLLHSDFNLSAAITTNLFNNLEPKEDCRGSNCAIYDVTEFNVHEDWLAWKTFEGDTTEYIQEEISRLKTTYLSSEEAVSDNEMLSLRMSSTNVLWEVPMVPKDGNYKIRAKSNCGFYTSQTTSQQEEIAVQSLTHDVFSDRIQPELFGSIQPIDGILNPNDDVIVTFNESINEIAFNTSSAQTYIEVMTRKNRTAHTHDSYLYFGSDDSLNIPSGVYLNQSFTLEMWLKPESNGVLFEQSNGTDSEVIKMSVVDFDTDPKLQFDYIHPTDPAQSQTVNHSIVLPSTGFTHLALAYDAENHEVIFLDGTGSVATPSYSFNMNYVGDGPIIVGAHYQGAMHDLRVWSKVAGDIQANRSINLSGKEANLVGYWPMDELRSNPKDKARYRHAQTTAQWAVESENKALSLDYNPALIEDFSALQDSSTLAIVNGSDFTIELWFNTAVSDNQTLFTLGSWDQGANFETWSFDVNAGAIEIFQGDTIDAPVLHSNTSYNDGEWHHMAMVKNARSNTKLYLDGVEVDQKDSEFVGGITSSSTYLGHRRVLDTEAASVEYTNHYNGLIDELRIWNIAKSHDRVLSEMHSNISDKLGLEQSTDFNEVKETATIFVYSELDVPLIRASELKTSVSFHDVSNGDQIAINLTESLSRIENTSIDFTLQKVRDLSGNLIESPISWSTYIDKNQLIWDNEFIEMEKLLSESLSFTTHIINQGGTVENFQISNLPPWLNAYPSEGLLDPNSFTQIEFVVNEDLFIGDYKEDILLVGNNNYAERMEFNLNVEMVQPEYSVDPQDYEYVMNFVGKVTVEGIRSRDEMDLLFAYVGEELRGAASPIYIEEYDSYIIFLSVYGDQVNGEEVSFRLWDASAGKFQTRVKINGQDLHDFQPSFVIGSFTELAHFEATNILRQDIVLNEGWNWVSFNLNSLEEQDDLDDVLQVSTVMNQVDGSSVSIFKNQYAFTQFAEIDGYNDTWIGSLTELPITDMFMIKTQKSDTIIYEGKIVNPSDVPISINAGWNWISYLGQRIMSTNDALSSLNPSSGDVIKNKSAFSMYASESLGWLGTLNSMESGHGYMLNTESNGSLIYPESSIFRISDYQLNKNQLADQFVEVNNAMYQNSMSMVAKIDLEKYSQPDLSNILAAYSDHLCLGNINATPINEEESLYFITIYGDEGYNISFKYFDQVTGDYFQAQNTLEFEANKLIGSIQDPYPIVLVDSPEDLLKAYSLDVYPNPFKEEFEVEFSLENEEIISIVIYDVTGRKVKDLYSGLLKSGLHNLDIDASDIAKGSYFIELKLNDSSFRKIIIKS